MFCFDQNMGTELEALSLGHDIFTCFVMVFVDVKDQVKRTRSHLLLSYRAASADVVVNQSGLELKVL